MKLSRPGCLSFVLFLVPGFQTFAQSTPSEFAEMSLQELFDLDVGEANLAQADAPKWSINYQYKSIEFDGYLDGDSSLNIDDVLWSGPEEIRTSKNFPIVPTVIRQNVHLLSIGYQISPELGVYLSAPYIEQETDHISIVTNYHEFIIKTNGVGDTLLSGRYQFIDTVKHNWWFGFGLSFPTGSIDQTGDTPRAQGHQQLPYTMQLGSGTYDFPLELSYQHNGKYDISLKAAAVLRTGTNDRHYRLGNNYRISGKYTFGLSQQFSMSVAGEFQYSESIKGEDDSLSIESPYPYPASITNPELYGGRKLLLKAGVNWKIDDQMQLGVELGKPVYQNLNGPQPGETWRSAIQISAVF